MTLTATYNNIESIYSGKLNEISKFKQNCKKTTFNVKSKKILVTLYKNSVINNRYQIPYILGEDGKRPGCLLVRHDSLLAATTEQTDIVDLYQKPRTRDQQ